MEQFWGNKEYRAVFGNPHNEDRRMGSKTHDTIIGALSERPERSEETHEFVVGVEERAVSKWSSVSVRRVMEEVSDSVGKNAAQGS